MTQLRPRYDIDQVTDYLVDESNALIRLADEMQEGWTRKAENVEQRINKIIESLEAIKQML